VAATNKNLAQLVRKGQFREDLYYRLNVVKIQLPPLSDRREDIPLLVDHFLQRFNLKMNKRISSVSSEVMNLLMRYDFPGNIREMENAIEHAFVICRDPQIRLEHLPEELIERTKDLSVPAGISKDPLRDAEKQAIQRVLEKYGGNRRKGSPQSFPEELTSGGKCAKIRLAFRSMV
ncbi:MAG: sigma 54-interacting transcriptional regulator, partial [Deltaproteobacteria bacterium]|nr:sigma 54-interacting transcriptional regulator [Deltaproteobacteria bacterium]